MVIGNESRTFETAICYHVKTSLCLSVCLLVCFCIHKPEKRETRSQHHHHTGKGKGKGKEIKVKHFSDLTRIPNSSYHRHDFTLRCSFPFPNSFSLLFYISHFPIPFSFFILNSILSISGTFL